jgi:glycerol dehydrogenase
MSTAPRTHLSIFSSPERYVQGRDATEALGTQLQQVGLPEGAVLVVASKTPVRLLGDTWRRVLPPAGYEPVVFDFPGACTSKIVAAIGEEAKRRSVVAILAAGGGQAIDAARAAADDVGVPMISCPTVASTDGEYKETERGILREREKLDKKSWKRQGPLARRPR